MFYGRKFAKPQLDDYKDSAQDLQPGKCKMEPLQDLPNDATIVTSAIDDEALYHMPVIDLDVPCNRMPASRLGHSHLYINHAVSQEGLFEILEVLAKHGIVEPGYFRASKVRGYSAVRLPWIKKMAAVVKNS